MYEHASAVLCNLSTTTRDPYIIYHVIWNKTTRNIIIIILISKFRIYKVYLIDGKTTLAMWLFGIIIMISNRMTSNVFLSVYLCECC